MDILLNKIATAICNSKASKGVDSVCVQQVEKEGNSYKIKSHVLREPVIQYDGLAWVLKCSLTSLSYYLMDYGIFWRLKGDECITDERLIEEYQEREEYYREHEKN